MNKRTKERLRATTFAIAKVGRAITIYEEQ